MKLLCIAALVLFLSFGCDAVETARDYKRLYDESQETVKNLQEKVEKLEGEVRRLRDKGDDLQAKLNDERLALERIYTEE